MRTPMLRALQLARAVRGFTSPNPPVGAVIVRAGEIVGEGATQPPGGPHAEIMALRMAGERAAGATMFVTLEPHSFHGRTPPCTDAIIAAGITAVHVAVRDPNPQVNGQGIAQLQAAGIIVSEGDHADEARLLIAPFAHWLRTGRSLGIAKFAMSLDGKIATRTGQSQWITSAASREHAHQLRQSSDGILVGIQTALADDPLLTTRTPTVAPDQIRHPLRIVVDSHGRLPASARMVQPATPGTTLIATTAAASPAWRETMMAHSVEIAVLPADEQGKVKLTDLFDLLGKRGLLTVLIEGGATVMGALVATGLVHQVEVYIAPRIIGGATAPGPVGDPGFAQLADALDMHLRLTEAIGYDLHLSYGISDSMSNDDSHNARK